MSASTLPNTPQLWDSVWQDQVSPSEHRYRVAVEEQSVRWRGIVSRVKTAFGGFEGLRVIEIGAGAGTNAALMARRGARVTVLDYSDRALEQAHELFEANQVTTELIKANALFLPRDLYNRFDIAMSFGLNEHFTGGDRLQIFSSHLATLTNGGITFISVPNAHNIPYRTFKWVAQTTHRWKLGVEVPFTHKELEGICARLGIRDFELFGDAFLTSLLNFLNPVVYLAKHSPRHSVPNPLQVNAERASPFDDRWGYATVLVMRKRAEVGDSPPPPNLESQATKR